MVIIIDKIGNTIIEDGIIINGKLKNRETIRGIVIKDNTVLMLYSKNFNDYTFPGGGIKGNENHEECLKRELFEELGAQVLTLIEPVGYIEEVRYGISGNDSVYNQKSYYYICKIDKVGKPNFKGREQEDTLEAQYVDIDYVISHNNKIIKDKNHEQKGFKTVLLRENCALKYIKKTYLKKNL